MTTVAFIHSPIEALNRLVIYPFPAKPMAKARVARGAYNTIVAMDEKGRLYSSQVSGGAVTRRNLEHCRIGPTMEGLTKLGVVTAGMLHEHKKLIEAEETLARRRSDARDLLREAKDLGIKLTKAQTRIVDKALAETD